MYKSCDQGFNFFRSILGDPLALLFANLLYFGGYVHYFSMKFQFLALLERLRKEFHSLSNSWWHAILDGFLKQFSLFKIKLRGWIPHMYIDTYNGIVFKHPYQGLFSMMPFIFGTSLFAP